MSLKKKIPETKLKNYETQEEPRISILGDSIEYCDDLENYSYKDEIIEDWLKKQDKELGN